MDNYVGQMMLVCFFVDFLLIMGTNSLCGYPIELVRPSLAALYGGIFSGLCLVSNVDYFNTFPCFMGILVFVGLIAFGVSLNSLRKCGMYILLNLALNGLAQNFGAQSLGATVLGAISLFVVCLVVLRDRFGGKTYIPVELSYNNKNITITALQDTGNDLRDPITGKSVLVIDVDAAERLMGLSRQQLCCPVEAIGMLPGLRLIPYKSVGGSGFLLAMRLSDVKVGSWRGSGLVAFSPEVLSAEGSYQALTGGIV